MRRLPVGRLLRRPVHRQHHGLRRRGDRLGAARLIRRARALRVARCAVRGLRPGGDEPSGAAHSAARHRHARGAGECGDGGRRFGRFDQRRSASAGDRARGGHRLRPRRRLRDLPANALHRRPQAGRTLRRQGHVRGGRRAGAAEGALRRRLHPRRLPHRHRPHRRREPGGRGVSGGSGRDPADLGSAIGHRWRRRPEGLAGAARSDRQDRRPFRAEIPRARALLRIPRRRASRPSAAASTGKARCW